MSSVGSARAKITTSSPASVPENAPYTPRWPGGRVANWGVGLNDAGIGPYSSVITPPGVTTSARNHTDKASLVLTAPKDRYAIITCVYPRNNKEIVGIV